MNNKNQRANFNEVALDILENVHVGLFVLDPQFRIFWANKTIEEFFGIPRDELIGQSKRVLFVDDEESMLEISKKVLESLGYEVEVYNDPERAYQIFCSDPKRFDLVITDRIMPKMRGEKLAERIHDVTPEIPIVLCTGYSDLPRDRMIEELGIRALVMKPLKMRDLAVRIREVLDNAK